MCYAAKPQAGTQYGPPSGVTNATGMCTLIQENDCEQGKIEAKFPEIKVYWVISSRLEDLGKGSSKLFTTNIFLTQITIKEQNLKSYILMFFL